MALQHMLSTRICSNFLRSIVLFQKYFRKSQFSCKTPFIEVDDVLDNFTKALVQKQLYSWELKHIKYKSLKTPSLETFSTVNVAKISKEELNEMLTSALYECNDLGVVNLIVQCVKHNICPNQDLLMQILNCCAQQGELIIIQDLKKLCELEKFHLPKHFDFSLYEAYAIWRRGNVIKALDMFEDLYTNNPFLRRHLKSIIKRLMLEEMKNNSEAVLLKLVKFAVYIADNYKDYVPMIYVWEICFLSEWFSDQQIALELLSKNRRLGDLLIHRLPYLLNLSLKHHKTEAIYRLLEILLKFEMEEQYGAVVMALLDYQFLQGNLRSYAEILKWCRGKEITLPSIYVEKYLQLLLNKKEDHDYTPPKNNKNNFKF